MGGGGGGGAADIGKKGPKRFSRQSLGGSKKQRALPSKGKGKILNRKGALPKGKIG